MTEIRTAPTTASIEGDFVVFLIGMRINAVWKLHKWLPVFFAMPRMLRELSRRKNFGLLNFRTRWGGRNIEVIQYWRSIEDLLAYANTPNAEHFPAWSRFNQRVDNDGSVGIWHETYLIKSGCYEAIYRNMPVYGLAQASQAVPATGKQRTASGRLGQ
jgi:hypothetical protein